MELDDFRRSWKLPTAAEAPVGLDTAVLTKMLANGSKNPVSKMRRNAWLEIAFVVLCLLICGAVLLVTQQPYTRALLVWLIIMCLSSGFYFRKKLHVLHCLSDASGALREHVARQISSLRGLVKLYYQATMWSLPVSFIIGLFFVGGRITEKFSGQKMLLGLTILVVAYGAVWALTHMAMRWFTHWYLQRLYGQHLDRLESMLQELEE
ncbi:hypothetical protein [Hymenobacter volaticus]|uniref:Uncharacterized protein n=1 Tax=Hymenobacter volaticus TaxID=2932254 RepID=A0ABY4G8N3_9BACT|nr:hypothetical protein [Hymenobacter volaticus]UOQ67243.1 hypothetical protein MUN86_04940 [Hymenobacter volaticus]